MPKNVRAGKGDAASSAPLAAPAISRHNEFYLSDEMTIFQVEHRLFRVHRHFLAENSPIFNSMFSLPRIPSDAGAAAIEGTSDENPIYLSGVTELEFEALLRYFYKSMHDGFSLPQSSWIALLSIAQRYECLNVRERAIREIYEPLRKWDEENSSQESDSGSDSDSDSGWTSRPKSKSKSNPEPDHLTLILTAEKYDVPLQHVLPSFVELVRRGEPLTEDEIARLSTPTVHRLARARETFLRRITRARRLRLGVRNVAKGIVHDIWPPAKK